MDIVVLVEKFGFTTIMVVGLGYFVYFVWQTITNTIDPAVSEMKKTIIRLTDQLRLLDQDMIRLQQKVNTVLELKEQEVHKNGKKEKQKNKLKKQEAEKNRILWFVIVYRIILFVGIFTQNLRADQIVHKFKSPSFNGSRYKFPLA